MRTFGHDVVHADLRFPEALHRGERLPLKVGAAERAEERTFLEIADVGVVARNSVGGPQLEEADESLVLQEVLFGNDPACGDRGEDVVAVSADLLAALTGYGEVGDVAALEIVVGVGEQPLIDMGHDLAVAGFVVVVDEYPP